MRGDVSICVHASRPNGGICMFPFIVRTFKSWMSRANRPWVNTYEFHTSDGPFGQWQGTTSDPTIDPAKYQEAMNAVLEFERAIHSTNVQFLRATASTWIADSRPYQGDELVTLDVNYTGQRESSPAISLDLGDVLMLKRSALTGRSGKMFYRGVLNEGDVQGTTGKFTLDPVSDLATAVAAAVGTHLSDQLVSSEPPPNTPVLALIGGTLVKTLVPVPGSTIGETKVRRTYVAPFYIRPVTNILIGKVARVSTDHRYFDRP